jgi:hypothetical protein
MRALPYSWSGLFTVESPMHIGESPIKSLILQRVSLKRPSSFTYSDIHADLPMGYGVYPSPASRARIMAWARSATCNLLKIFET